MIKTLIYEIATGSIIDELGEDAEINGLNPIYAYGVYDIPEEATNISEGTQKPSSNRKKIFKDILDKVRDNQSQKDKFLALMDKYPTLLFALDNSLWGLARNRLALAVTNSDITQNESDAISALIPE